MQLHRRGRSCNRGARRKACAFPGCNTEHTRFRVNRRRKFNCGPGAVLTEETGLTRGGSAACSQRRRKERAERVAGKRRQKPERRQDVVATAGRPMVLPGESLKSCGGTPRRSTIGTAKYRWDGAAAAQLRLCNPGVQSNAKAMPPFGKLWLEWPAAGLQTGLPRGVLSGQARAISAVSPPHRLMVRGVTAGPRTSRSSASAEMLCSETLRDRLGALWFWWHPGAFRPAGS